MLLLWCCCNVSPSNCCMRYSCCSVAVVLLQCVYFYSAWGPSILGNFRDIFKNQRLLFCTVHWELTFFSTQKLQRGRTWSRWTGKNWEILKSQCTTKYTDTLRHTVRCSTSVYCSMCILSNTCKMIIALIIAHTRMCVCMRVCVCVCVRVCVCTCVFVCVYVCVPVE